jgi:hypothetical protein
MKKNTRLALIFLSLGLVLHAIILYSYCQTIPHGLSFAETLEFSDFYDAKVTQAQVEAISGFVLFLGLRALEAMIRY